MAMASFPRFRVALVRTLLRGPTVGARVLQQAPPTALASFRSLSTERLQRHVGATDNISGATPDLDTSASQVPATFQLPEDATTAGRILQYINTECKDETTNAHIQALINACAEPKDLPSILHAITTFKRTRNYVMTTETANMAIEKILDCHKTNKLEGSLLVLENFKERTGLYYSASTGALNKTLDRLYEAMMDEQEIAEETKERVWKALLRLTEGLIRRKAPPKMKKRAKRAYYNSLQEKVGGPRQRTVRRVAQIGILVKTPEETWETLIQPFQTAKVSINEKTLAWIEAKRRNESGEDDGEEEGGETVEVAASEGDIEDQGSASDGDEPAGEVDASEHGDGVEASEDAKKG